MNDKAVDFYQVYRTAIYKLNLEAGYALLAESSREIPLVLLFEIFVCAYDHIPLDIVVEALGKNDSAAILSRIRKNRIKDALIDGQGWEDKIHILQERLYAAEDVGEKIWQRLSQLEAKQNGEVLIFENAIPNASMDVKLNKTEELDKQETSKENIVSNPNTNDIQPESLSKDCDEKFIPESYYKIKTVKRPFHIGLKRKASKEQRKREKLLTNIMNGNYSTEQIDFLLSCFESDDDTEMIAQVAKQAYSPATMAFLFDFLKHGDVQTKSARSQIEKVMTNNEFSAEQLNYLLTCIASGIDDSCLSVIANPKYPVRLMAEYCAMRARKKGEEYYG